MSSIFLTSNANAPSSQVVKSLKFTEDTMAERLLWNSLTGVVTRVDDLRLWGPASDNQSGVKVALGGRVAFDRALWRTAETLPFKGGLACRAILSEWLKNPGGIDAWLNGAFCAIIYDPRVHQLHVFTDRMGMFPVYLAEQGGFWLSSHPDVLADGLKEAGIPTEIDWTTIAEFLSTGSSVQPYTYYKAIRQMEAATHYIWNLNETASPPQSKSYWEPAYLHKMPKGTKESRIGDLAEAFKAAIHRRTYDFLGTTAVFLSGGADSRAMLFGVEQPQNVQCVTFFDEANAELETSRRLAEAAGARHHHWQRDFDYYGRTARDIVRISGGIWSFMDGHYLGFLDRITALNLGTVLTGCYADYMFKGLAFNGRYRTFLGKNIPLKELAPFNYEFYQPHLTLAKKWHSLVHERLDLRFTGCVSGQCPANPLAVEEKRLRPLSREPDSSGRAILWRTTPFDWAFGDNDVLKVYGQLSVEDKLNGIVFEKAVAKVVGKAGADIFNNNYRTCLGASEKRRKWQFLCGVAKRKLHRALGRHQESSGVATTGSWPDWSYYIAHSELISKLWMNPSHGEQELFLDFLGVDAWERATESWAHDPHFFIRLLTLRLWLDIRGYMV